MKLCLLFVFILDLLFVCIGGLEDNNFSGSDDSSPTNSFLNSETFFPSNATLEEKGISEEVTEDVPESDGIDGKAPDRMDGDLPESDPKDGKVSESDRTDDDLIKVGSTDESDDINACGNPPVVERARISGRTSPPYAVGTSLSYSCEFGYSADRATHTSTCTRSSKDNKPSWTDPQIVCIPRACGDPGFVANAERVGSQFTFPNSVSFECDDGYKLLGPNIRYCQVNGRWSSTLPSCEKITCETPEKPENGEVIFSSLDYGSSLRYTCDQGFILKNYHPRICSENGTWSGTEPFCAEAKCDFPVAPKHGSVEMVGGIPRIDSIAVFSCEGGRKLVGSSISKCLDIGEWTFPAPKCLEPCSVLNVEFGAIGKYGKHWNSRKQFKALNPGTGIQDGEELILRCNENYEPLGQNTAEVKISCEKSEWKEDPVCKPAKCRAEPPATENARIARFTNEHGGIVVYHCKKHFRKSKFGNVTCHYGIWRGNTPVCADERCYVDKMGFAGIKKDEKNIYLNEQIFKPSCDVGYEELKPDNTFTCEKGVWKGLFPPCTAASCSEPPPSIEHGYIKSYKKLHSSFVQYECEDSFMLTSSKVQCLFGEWKGDPPKCKNNVCYFQDLKNKEGMLSPPKEFTENGKRLDVQCEPGYHKFYIEPFCTGGEWIETKKSSCKQNSCTVFAIENGAITDRSYHTKFTLRGRVTEQRYKEVRIGDQIDAGKSFFITCTGDFTFQGENRNDVETTCTRGKWKPTPVCLIPGTIYKEESEDVTVAHRNSNAVNVKDFINYTTTTSTTTLPVSEPPESVDNCFCVYTGSENLVAYVDNQLLETGSKVKRNSIVKLRCRNFGFDRLSGNRELMCKQCRPWDVSEYPRCDPPSNGDAIILFDEKFKILPGGVLTVDQGLDASLWCFGAGVWRYPIWTFPLGRVGIESRHLYDNRHEPNPYLGHLKIRNTSPLHNGEYKCALDGYGKTYFQLQVIARCKTFEESDDLNIHYDDNQNVNSSALFTCRDKKKKIEGSSVLTCLKNGQWSRQAPRCISLGCQELEARDNMDIVYSEGIQTGSVATFHCRVPSKRKGVSFLKCLPNGEWTGKVPTCILPSCSLEELYDQLPQTVTADLKEEVDNILPYEFEVKLICDGNMMLSSPATAQCGIDGKWIIPVTKCVPGCPPFQILPGSQIIIEPKKDFYMFGEYVELSCVPGQVLSNEVEVLMCLRTGWSENEIPTCKDQESTEA